MAFPACHLVVRCARGLSATALGLAMAACGGGGVAMDDRAATVAKPAPLQPAGRAVTLEGCVTDRHYIPTTGTPVRALAADGRLLGNAQSDGRGHFTLTLPPHSEVLLQVDRPEGASQALRTGATSSLWERCLQDDQA